MRTSHSFVIGGRWRAAWGLGHIGVKRIRPDKKRQKAWLLKASGGGDHETSFNIALP